MSTIKPNPGQSGAPHGQLRRTAIYTRVSTAYQTDKDSLPMQRRDLIAYSELILGIPDYEIFEDAGYSGKNTDRPAFQNMMSKIRRREFSHVLVWKIDRISRNLLDFSEMYAELQQLQVTFVSKNEQFDTSTAMGGAMLKIILVFAELERNMTSERVTATMISRATHGQWNGGRVPYGYSYDPETHIFSVNEEEASVCRMICDDYLRYHSIIHTERLLNGKGLRTRSGAEWSSAGLWIILSNPFYTGAYRYNHYRNTDHREQNPEEEWVLVPGHHPAIFTEDEYEKIKTLMSENNKRRNSPGKQCVRKMTHVFNGLCYCGKCGARMIVNSWRTLSDGYIDTSYRCSRSTKTNGCSNTYASEARIGEFVLNYVLNMLNARKCFSDIHSPEELENRLLRGNTFAGIDHIEPSDLNEFYDLLRRHDHSDTARTVRPRRKKPAPDPETDALRREKEKQERAMKRLQDLYLYSDNAMSEKDFIMRKAEISERLSDIQRKLGMVAHGPDNLLTDEEFIQQASHLLIASRLNEREYIYYRNFATSVSADVLHEYMSSIIDNILIAGGRVIGIIFRNGLSQRFIWK